MDQDQDASFCDIFVFRDDGQCSRECFFLGDAPADPSSTVLETSPSLYVEEETKLHEEYHVQKTVTTEDDDSYRIKSWQHGDYIVLEDTFAPVPRQHVQHIEESFLMQEGIQFV